jgi:hypothetical protein
MTGIRVILLSLHKMCLLAMVGFAVIFLSGPVIGLLSVIFSLVVSVFAILLPFALVGFLIWLPIRALTSGKHLAWREATTTTRSVCGGVFRRSYSACRYVTSGSAGGIRNLWHRIHFYPRAFGGLLLEVVSGAAVGAVLGGALGMRHDTYEASIPLGVLAGATLGFVIGASRLRDAVDAGEADRAPV